MSKEIIDRFRALTDLNATLNHNNMSINNHGVELKRIIAENDIARLEDLEAKWAEFQLVKEVQDRNQTRLANGAAKRELALAVLDLFTGYLDELDIGDDNLDLLEDSLESVFQALNRSRPGKAKTLIENLPVEGILTQEIKDDILSLYPKED